jgi:hypothetical protein
MSRSYEASITISNYNVSNEFWIKDVCFDNWNWDELKQTSNNNEIYGFGKSSLCGGEHEEEFARRLTRAIWKANNGFCKVEIVMTCLENLPFEVYQLDENEYHKSCSIDAFEKDRLP